MRIETLRPTSVTTAKRAERRGSGTVFSGLLDSSDVSSNAAAPAQPLNVLTSLIGIQLDENAQDAQRQHLQAVAVARDALDVLQDVQRALVLGTASVTHLQQLRTQLSRGKITSLDPRLSEIAAEIEIRLAVEIAKMEYAQTH
jgi:Class II flagellar assembly regulator